MIRKFICKWLANKAFNYIGHFMDYSDIQPNSPQWHTLCEARSIIVKYIGD